MNDYAVPTAIAEHVLEKFTHAEPAVHTTILLAGTSRMDSVNFTAYSCV